MLLELAIRLSSVSSFFPFVSRSVRISSTNRKDLGLDMTFLDMSFLPSFVILIVEPLPLSTLKKRKSAIRILDINVAKTWQLTTSTAAMRA